MIKNVIHPKKYLILFSILLQLNALISSENDNTNLMSSNITLANYNIDKAESDSIIITKKK